MTTAIYSANGPISSTNSRSLPDDILLATPNVQSSLGRLASELTPVNGIPSVIVCRLHRLSFRALYTCHAVNDVPQEIGWCRRAAGAIVSLAGRDGDALLHPSEAHVSVSHLSQCIVHVVRCYGHTICSSQQVVALCADLFCLTPKHFATVIKEHTGINALQWINNYVIIQAKTLLRSRQQMTIQQIAHHLGFQDQASFSRFFKSQTGVTPTEYRSTIWKK